MLPNVLKTRPNVARGIPLRISFLSVFDQYHFFFFVIWILVLFFSNLLIPSYPRVSSKQGKNTDDVANMLYEVNGSVGGSHNTRVWVIMLELKLVVLM